jgi:hypothetical protein
MNEYMSSYRRSLTFLMVSGMEANLGLQILFREPQEASGPNRPAG